MFSAGVIWYPLVPAPESVAGCFMDMHLKNRVVVITGGASGIGLACARAFAAEWAGIALWDLGDHADLARGLAEKYHTQQPNYLSEATLKSSLSDKE